MINFASLRLLNSEFYYKKNTFRNYFLNKQKKNLLTIFKISINYLKDEIDVIDSLTGIPVEEDELLFCLTVCAPYSTLQSYK